MAKILDRLVYQLKKNGMSKDKAYAVAVSRLQKAGNLKRGSTEPTSKGKKRGEMTPAQRAKDRARKTLKTDSGKTVYYNKKNNSATLKRPSKSVKARA